MARKRATLTDLLNDLTARVIYDKFRLLACSAFEWGGLPDGIEERYIERLLFDNGRAVFFRDPKMSYMALEVSDLGRYNVYGEPVEYLATGVGYQRHMKASDCVIIRNNQMQQATRDFVLFYVNKLQEAERTMDTNVKTCKTPYVFVCDDKDVLTFKQIFKKIDGNEPAIYADKGLNLDAIDVLKTEAKFIGNELMDYKKSVENELLTFLGFNNLAVDKKERVNVSEANSNNEMTRSFAELQLIMREQACKEINKKYSLSLTVKRREVESDVRNESVQHDQGDA